MVIIIDAETDFSLSDGSVLKWDQSVQLEDFIYLFRFIWSKRENCYYLNIYDQDENPIALFIRLVCGVDLLRKFKDPRLPKGLLQVSDLAGTNLDLSVPSDLNGNYPLTYITSDDDVFANPEAFA